MLTRVRRDLKMKRKPPQRKAATVSRRNPTPVLAQSALAVPRVNWGGAKASTHMSVPAMMRAMDARIPRTLGLPRAVGPYTIIRTSKLHSSNANFIMFCPFQRTSANGPTVTDAWWNWCGVEDVQSSDPINGSGNTRPILMPLEFLGGAASVVPASMTVQVMNPAPVQTAQGAFAMCRVNQQLDVANATYSYDELISRVVAFYSPRILTGGKLSLRGVKCSSYPLDMTEYASFLPIQAWPTTDGVPIDTTWTNAISPSALAPIVLVQANVEPQTLQYLITIEWRVRFDPGNPATSSHIHHDTLSDECWNKLMSTASSAGHAVEELTEDVADGGAMGGGAVLGAARAAAAMGLL